MVKSLSICFHCSTQFAVIYSVRVRLVYISLTVSSSTLYQEHPSPCLRLHFSYEYFDHKIRLIKLTSCHQLVHCNVYFYRFFKTSTFSFHLLFSLLFLTVVLQCQSLKKHNVHMRKLSLFTCYVSISRRRILTLLK